MKFNNYSNGMMAKANPCFKCNKRYFGCHSGCKEYLIYKSRIEEIRAKKGKYNEVNSYTKMNAKKRVHSERLLNKLRAER